MPSTLPALRTSKRVSKLPALRTEMTGRIKLGASLGVGIAPKTSAHIIPFLWDEDENRRKRTS